MALGGSVRRGGPFHCYQRLTARARPAPRRRIGFYSSNHTGVPGEPPWKSHGEPTWHSLSQRCPNVAEDVCECDGIYFVSKDECKQVGELVKNEGFRGVFPWAANYDSRDPSDSLIHYVGLGLGIS